MPIVVDKDACDLLDADHIAVKHLFVEYARLATMPAADDGTERAVYAAKICQELSVHAQIEEEIFYPALQQALPGSGDLLEEARAEHQQAKDLIAQIEGAEPGPAMDDLVAELNRAIEHHVKEERDELFPKARSAKGMDLVALGAKLRARQLALQAPMAPGG